MRERVPRQFLAAATDQSPPSSAAIYACLFPPAMSSSILAGKFSSAKKSAPSPVRSPRAHLRSALLTLWGAKHVKDRIFRGRLRTRAEH